MRMLVVGRTQSDPASSLRMQLVDSLRFLGHQVVTAYAVAGESSRSEARLRSMLQRFDPEVLVHVPSPGTLDAATMRRLTAETGTVSVCLHRGPSCPSASTDLSTLSDDLRDYDLVAVPDSFTYAGHQAEGTFRLSLLPPAVHVPGLAGAVPSDRRGVVVVGDADPSNVDVVAGLDVLDDVLVLGEGWDELPLRVGVADCGDLVDRGTLFAGCRLVVELPTSLRHQSDVRRHYSELGLSDAVLQAAAVSTPSVVLSRPGVRELLDPGTEVLTCDSLGDLIALVPMLLASPDDLAAVGEAACARVTADHSWVSRWGALLDPWIDPHEVDGDEDVWLVDADTAQATAGV